MGYCHSFSTISGLVQASAAPAGAPACSAPKLVSQQDVEHYIVESEDAWAKSVATNDASVVKRILADDLIWVLDGKLVDKPTAVKWAAAGQVSFSGIILTTCMFVSLETRP